MKCPKCGSETAEEHCLDDCYAYHCYICNLDFGHEEKVKP
jgi:hypothetical protein